MAAIRILVVDDSLVTRKVLSDTLSKDPDLEVVATASDGQSLWRRSRRCIPMW
jgi:two-component system, chemotaxis family, protein-glutamate methylesterase/glutaminase